MEGWWVSSRQTRLELYSPRSVRSVRCERASVHAFRHVPRHATQTYPTNYQSRAVRVHIFLFIFIVDCCRRITLRKQQRVSSTRRTDQMRSQFHHLHIMDEHVLRVGSVMTRAHAHVTCFCPVNLVYDTALFAASQNRQI